MSEEIITLLNSNSSYWNDKKRDLLLKIIKNIETISFPNKLQIIYNENANNCSFNPSNLTITINQLSISVLIHELTHGIHYIQNLNNSETFYEYPDIFGDLNKKITYDKFTISKLSILLQKINSEKRKFSHPTIDKEHNKLIGFNNEDEKTHYYILSAISGMIDSILCGKAHEEGISVEYSNNYDEHTKNVRGPGHTIDYFECSIGNIIHNSTFNQDKSIYDGKEKGLIFSELIADYSSVIFLDPENSYLEELKRILGQPIMDILDNYLFKIFNLEQIISNTQNQAHSSFFNS